MTLQNISIIFTGHTIRSRVSNDPAGECFIIQVKDLNADNTRIVSIPHRSPLSDIPGRQLLQKGDILLLAKNNKNSAILYRDEFPYAVAVSVFTVIRLTTQQVSPEFLTWYLNSKTVQDYFGTNRVGTHTQNLPKQAVAMLEVPVPPKNKQQSMLRLINEYEKYKTLQLEYENNINLLIETLLEKQLNP